MQQISWPSVAHRLSARPSTPWTCPQWLCDCGETFSDPQLAAEHTSAPADPERRRRPRAS